MKGPECHWEDYWCHSPWQRRPWCGKGFQWDYQNSLWHCCLLLEILESRSTQSRAVILRQQKGRAQAIIYTSSGQMYKWLLRSVIILCACCSIASCHETVDIGSQPTFSTGPWAACSTTCMFRRATWRCCKLPRRWLNNYELSPHISPSLVLHQKEVPMIFLPCHKSHIDYILISFILLHYNIKVNPLTTGHLHFSSDDSTILSLYVN